MLGGQEGGTPSRINGVVVRGAVAVLTPSRMRGVLAFTQFFLHTSLGQPFCIVFCFVPHLHEKGLIMLSGQSSRINGVIVGGQAQNDG